MGLEPGRRTVVGASLLAGTAGSAAACALAAPALYGVDPVKADVTAAALGVSAVAVVVLGTVGAAAPSRFPRIHAGMAGVMLGLLAVGFPVFVALEPAWWRYGVGMVGPVLVAAHVVFGAHVLVETPARRQGRKRVPHTAFTLAWTWLVEPARTSGAVVASLLGLDARTPAQRKRA